MNRVTAECQTLRDHLPALSLVVSLAVVFVIRWCIAATHIDMGGDIATYLATTNAFFGQDPTGFGLDRPPLIALPLRVFTLVFGDINGVKLLGVLLSVAIGVPFYLLAKRISHPWIAVAMTIVFVLTPAYSDMLTWGYITMFGMMSGLLCLHFFLLLLHSPSRINVFLTGLFASFIVGFHQLSLAFFVPLFLLLVGALFIFDRERLTQNLRPVAIAGAVALLLSIPYVPLYLRMLRMGASPGSEASVSLTPLFVPWILGIVLSLAFAVIALRWTWQRDRGIAIMVAVLLIYSLALILLELPQPFVELNRRAHLFMYPAVWLLASVVLSCLWSWRTVRISTLRRWLPKACAIAMMIVLLSSTTVLSFMTLHRALEFYDYLDNTRWDAVRWIANNTPRDASIATYPEALGWWTEAEAKRNTATVTDRDTVPYVFLRERSLAAERALSRNQGFENGNLRLATTYPYSGTPGQPVLGVHVSGSYHDTIMFDDRVASVAMEGGKIANLTADAEKEFGISGDSESMTMTTRYRIDGATVIQTATLHRSSQTAVISYSVQSDGASVAGLNVSVLFAFEPSSVSIAPDQRSIETTQFLRPKTDRVVTHINIGGDGATLQEAIADEDGLHFSFSIQSDEAVIAFNFDLADPELDSDADVSDYDVRRILIDPSLEHLSSIDYLAIDLEPNPHLASAAAWGTEEWLNACPYYELIYSEGDIRIYRVDASALL